tara:strand:- start:152 stop:289 length:138 start_codon:yes stop_codon:yes gene_type:complete
MRLLIEVEGQEAVEFIEEFQSLMKKLEELTIELTELRELLNAQSS